jgi:hypothetical protein
VKILPELLRASNHDGPLPLLKIALEHFSVMPPVTTREKPEQRPQQSL